MTSDPMWPMAAAAISCIAAITDLRTGKIYNWLTLPAALAAFCAHAWFDGPIGLGYSIAGWFVGVVVFLPLAAMGKMGMGDVKLLGAIGAIWGTKHCINVMLYAAVVSIPHSLFVLWWNYGKNAIPVLLVSLETGAFREKTIERVVSPDSVPPEAAVEGGQVVAQPEQPIGAATTPATEQTGSIPLKRIALKHGPDYFIGVLLAWAWPLPGLFG